MKTIITLFIVIVFSIASIAQKVAKVTFTTSIPIAEALQICKVAGKEAGFGSKDFDATSGKIILWRNYVGGNDHELQVQITSEIKDDKTVLTMIMPHLPNTMGSYIKELKKVTTKIHLPNQVISEYFDGVE